MATCFVSSITASMASVWNANRTSNMQSVILKKYLNQSKVSWPLASRITRYIDYVLENRKKNVHMSKVTYLSLLSKPLQAELQMELFLPHLINYGFLQVYADASISAMQELCLSAVSIQHFANTDGIFIRGSEAKDMIFLHGRGASAVYHTANIADLIVKLGSGDFVSEGVLWMPWVYKGDLNATSESEILCLYGKKFGNITCAHADLYRIARNHAFDFWKYFIEAPRSITDLPRSYDVANEPSL